MNHDHTAPGATSSGGALSQAKPSLSRDRRAALEFLLDNLVWLMLIVVLAVFSVTRLVTIVPITPGALGVAELSYVAGLTAAGVTATAAAGAVLLFRFLTWFLPIPTGVVTWLLWRAGVGQVRSADPAAVRS